MNKIARPCREINHFLSKCNWEVKFSCEFHAIFINIFLSHIRLNILILRQFFKSKDICIYHHKKLKRIDQYAKQATLGIVRTYEHTKEHPKKHSESSFRILWRNRTIAASNSIARAFTTGHSAPWVIADWHGPSVQFHQVHQWTNAKY